MEEKTMNVTENVVETMENVAENVDLAETMETAKEIANVTKEHISGWAIALLVLACLGGLLLPVAIGFGIYFGIKKIKELKAKKAGSATTKADKVNVKEEEEESVEVISEN